MPTLKETVADLPLKILHGFPYPMNAPLEEKKRVVTDTLLSLKEKGFGGVVSNVHFENYLLDADEWKIFAFLADECERLGMRLWIYDEKGYPSGGAGGLTLEADPSYEAAAVVMDKVTLAPGEERTLPLPHGHAHFLFAAVYAADADGAPIPEADGSYAPLAAADCRLSTEPVTLKNPSDAPALFCAFVRKRLYEGTHCVHNVSECRRYIDVTNPDAVREFLRNTYDRYAACVPEHLTAGAGREIPVPGKIEAVFTDEPSFMGCYINAGLWPHTVHDPYDKEIPLLPVLSYGRDVENAFRSRFGYELPAEFISIFLGGSARAQRVRLDYYTLLSDLYESAFFTQISDWCARHEISFSGHVLLEDLIMHHTVFEGNFFSLLRHMHTPGIDMLQSLPMLVRRDGFTPKLVSSVAHAYRRPHVMSEVSAHAQGGKVTRDQMYASLCVQYALGVDTFTYYYGERFMEPEVYAHYNTALGRINAAMSGKHVSEVLVCYPIETFRMHHRPSDAQYGSYTPEEIACQNGVTELQNALFDRQIDFDFADTEVLSRCVVHPDGSVTSPSGETAQAILLPPMETTPEISSLLERLAGEGASILSVSHPLFAPVKAATCFPDADALCAALDTSRMSVASQAVTPGVLTLTRDTAGGRAVMICSAREEPVQLSLTLAGLRDPELLDPLGPGPGVDAPSASGVSFGTTEDGRTTVTLTLAPCRTVIIRGKN